MAAERYIGLMSGTSLDGVDGVLADFSDGCIAVTHHATAPFPPDLRAELLALNTPGDNELHRAALAANGLAGVYADVVQQLLAAAGLAPADVQAVGAHGQTVRHRPGEFDTTGYTLQLNHPALLAERIGIDVVADFRSRDVAAGGQGAPLVPAFHRALFGQTDAAVAVLNVGGISNLSLLPPTGDTGEHDVGPVRGFDCGPGNALMDHWCQLHTGQPYDTAGRWAASGTVQPALLARLMDEPFLAKTPPKSTGRDLFNPSWLAARLGDTALAPIDVQATLTELTARACAADVLRHAPQSRALIVCGGGAFNTHLMARLSALLPGIEVLSSADRGLPPQQVEAAAFAWLARAAVQRAPGNLASVTGARGARVLGAIYPA
ncbi:anhydro-N-acetylmuramic acid kinase [Variovorax ginsengisoli]|uniref:Anhydro-N-acetylmuramic acid kinase n=1 Tax=Variovorax ginsengisoli TaxID=363844 RepID=A0ABT9S1R2_9BURK|nr:anhydro-N-acetylmuramic acid kinase [Variovorax ginsengisoli]MDP9898285.1 anhydro-N-acetylmuramic acid kinase [Variovorax ginsengisoli]